MQRQRTHLVAPLLAAWLIVTALLIGVMAPPASANHGARITVHVSTCPWAVPVDERYALCHDIGITGATFEVAGVWRDTDANSAVSWVPGAGTHTIYGYSFWLGSEQRAYVYCTNQITGAVLWDGNNTADDLTVEITTTAGQEVICDWYFLLAITS